MLFPRQARWWTRAASFDPHVGAPQERWWNRHSERARCLEVYHQLELGWLLDRQISRLCTTQNLVNEADDMPVTKKISRSVAEQPPILGGLGPLVDCRQVRIVHPVYN